MEGSSWTSPLLLRHWWQPFLLSPSAVLVPALMGTIMESSLQAANTRRCIPLRAPQKRVPQLGLGTDRTITPPTSMPAAVAAGPCNQPGQGPALSTSVPTATQPCHNSRVHGAHPWRNEIWCPGRIVLLGPTGHLLHTATPSRPGDVAELPNIQKQTELVNTRRQRTISQTKEQDETSKGINQNRDKQSTQ